MGDLLKDDQTSERVFELFSAVLPLSQSARAAVLDRACAGDEALRQQIEAMLQADAKSHSLLDTPIAHLRTVAPETDDESPAQFDGRIIGPYQILHELGRGGMGAVYLAERVDVALRAALKIVVGDLASSDHRARFLLERRVLAQLKHPGIASFLDAGVLEDGTPWFAMELVDGEPLNSYCDREQLSIAERLTLFEGVLEAVAYAHSNFIVHRDLKHSNVLVTAAGEAKLLDFGVARLLESEQEDANLTRTGIAPMTPDFASPEQILGEAVGPVTDVYQLGIMLYEILSGRRPYHLSGRSLGSIERYIVHELPVRPSTISRRSDTSEVRGSAQDLARSRGVSPRRLQQLIAGELDAIVMKALAKEPKRRYANAQAMLDDLQRYRQGLPVLARPDTFLYRVKKFAVRHPLSLGFTATLAVLMLGFSFLYTVRVTTERNLAQLESRKAERVSAFLVDLFTASTPFSTTSERIDTMSVRAFMEDRAARVVELEDQPEVQLEVLNTVGQMFTSMGVYDQALPLQEQAVALAHQLYDRPHREIAQSTQVLGEIYRQQSRYEDAEALFREVLADYQVLGLGDSLVAGTTLTGLGEALRQQGDFAEAEVFYSRALDMRRKAFPSGNPAVTQSLNNYALNLWRQGRVREAEPIFREALSAYQRQLPSDHPRIAAVMHNLGLVHRDLGQYDEAERMFRDSIVIKRSRLGEKHWRVAISLRNLARVYQQRGDLVEAERLAREALIVQEASLGSDHRDAYYDKTNLAAILRDQGKLNEAEGLYKEVLDWLGANLEPDHPDQADTRLGYGRLLLSQGRFAQAEPLLEVALDIHRQRLGPDHVKVAMVTSPLGALRTAQGRFDEAEKLLRGSLTTLDEHCYSPGCSVETAHRLIALYTAWGRPAEAVEQIRDDQRG